MNILCIDTALETASIGIVRDGELLEKRENYKQMDHAAWIHTAIRDLIKSTLDDVKNLSAFAVTSGPGSYTGLRVGMATAKGLCYALQVPLITENVLYLTALNAKNTFKADPGAPNSLLFCPMIDARRMEVFAAVYNQDLETIDAPRAIVLEESSFSIYLDKNKMVFCGNGSKKWSEVSKQPNAIFTSIAHKMDDFAGVAWQKLQKEAFSDLAYQEPDYFKNFYGRN